MSILETEPYAMQSVGTAILLYQNREALAWGARFIAFEGLRWGVWVSVKVVKHTALAAVALGSWVTHKASRELRTTADCETGRGA